MITVLSGLINDDTPTRLVRRNARRRESAWMAMPWQASLRDIGYREAVVAAEQLRATRVSPR